MDAGWTEGLFIGWRRQSSIPIGSHICDPCGLARRAFFGLSKQSPIPNCLFSVFAAESGLVERAPHLLA
jgi:hypothetical protein